MAGRPVSRDTPPPLAPPSGRSARPAGAVALVALITAGALLVAACGPDPAPVPLTPGTNPSASPVFADLSLVPVVASPSPSDVPTGTASAPSIATAAPSTSASAAPGEPIRAKRIRVERLDIDLRIVEGDGVDAPMGKAAHYPGSAWPGSGSNIYIYGHAQKGMFLSLWKVRVGDVVELDLVDGTTRRYLVDRVLPKVPWDAVKYLRPTDTEQLTLQTSTSYHPTSPRFIVIAYPAP